MDSYARLKDAVEVANRVRDTQPDIFISIILDATGITVSGKDMASRRNLNRQISWTEFELANPNVTALAVRDIAAKLGTLND